MRNRDLASRNWTSNKETRIGVKVWFVCKIFQRSLEGRILATANPKGELSTSKIQQSSQTEQMPVVGLSLICGVAAKSGILLLVLLDYRIVSRKLICREF